MVVADAVQDGALEERAQRILDAAMELADEGGFEAVRLRDVAKRSNVALGTLYARFGSKEEILVAALEQECQKLEALLAEYPVQGTTPLERVRHFFALSSAALFSRPNFARAVLRGVASGATGTSNHVMAFQGRVTHLIAHALRGEVRSESSQRPAPISADLKVCELMEQIWFAALVGWMGGRESEDDVINHMTWATEIVLSGSGIE